LVISNSKRKKSDDGLIADQEKRVRTAISKIAGASVF
jgi:hypothetical protein